MSNQSHIELGIVDTHVHFWQFELLRRVWQPPPVILRTFAPEDLIDDAAAVGVNRCVLVEAGTTDEDNHALGRFRGIVRVRRRHDRVCRPGESDAGAGTG